jgi:hypothetical protein
MWWIYPFFFLVQILPWLPNAQVRREIAMRMAMERQQISFYSTVVIWLRLAHIQCAHYRRDFLKNVCKKPFRCPCIAHRDRVGKNPGFKKKTNPGGFFGVLLGFIKICSIKFIFLRIPVYGLFKPLIPDN